MAATLSPGTLSAVSVSRPRRFTSKYFIQCCENPISESVKGTADINGLATFPEKNALRWSAAKVPPPRPRRIILVRHGQSEGNVDESVYARVADPKIALTEKGRAEAEECGKIIKELIEQDKVDNWKVYFYVSPYRRTLETLKNLARPFERSRIAGLREEPRLREQDFGTFFIWSTFLTYKERDFDNNGKEIPRWGVLKTNPPKFTLVFNFLSP